VLRGWLEGLLSEDFAAMDSTSEELVVTLSWTEKVPLASLEILDLMMLCSPHPPEMKHRNNEKEI